MIISTKLKQILINTSSKWYGHVVRDGSKIIAFPKRRTLNLIRKQAITHTAVTVTLDNCQSGKIWPITSTVPRHM